MQELRYILVALGGIAIAALLIHGLWSNRKNRQAPIKEKPWVGWSPSPVSVTTTPSTAMASVRCVW